jgi:sarcosine oxidase subunit alpha
MPRLPEFPEDCAITVDGRHGPARRGESVASALLAAGRPLVARSAKYHRPRGPFCLSGSCGSCLVRVSGLPDQRACRTACRDGLSVETQNAVPDAAHDLLGVIDVAYPHGLDHHHLMTWNLLANRAAVAVSRRMAGLGRLPPASAAIGAGPAPVEERWDALVVGAGPAGIAAAAALAGAGRRVLVADAEPRPGGRLRARLQLPGDPDLAWVERALGRVAAAGGEIATGAAVLGLFTDGGAPLAALGADAPGAPLRLVRPGRVLLCTGGTPQPPALEDGDRPGVHAARALLAALAEHGVVPGRRAVVLGEGAEAAGVAERLRAAGMEAEQVAGGAGRVRGRARVRALDLPDRRVRCDCVAVATPPVPATELGRALGAEVAFDPALGAFALRVDASGATGVAGLFAAGEITGRATAAEAAEAGRRAGEAASG